MTALERWADRLAGWLKWAGGISLLAMMVITCLDVVLRAAGEPVYGLVESVSLLAVVVLAAAMPLTQRQRGHVALDMVVRRLKPRTAAWVDLGGHVVAAALFGVASWRLWLYGARLMKAGQVSQSLQVPMYWPVMAAALAFAVLALALAADAMGTARRAVRNA